MKLVHKIAFSCELIPVIFNPLVNLSFRTLYVLGRKGVQSFKISWVSKKCSVACPREKEAKRYVL